MKNKKAKSILQGLKAATINKAINLLKALIAMYKEMIERGIALNVAISKGNRKIGNVLNVSLAPIITCGLACAHCMHICYDLKAVLQYLNVRLARARNTALALYARDAYFSQIENAMQRRRKNHYLRFHVGGDIPDYDYLCRMIQLASKYPHYIIWTYTKQYRFVNRYIAENGSLPNNLHIMFSIWKEKNKDGNIVIIPVYNPHDMPTFTIRFAEEEKPNMMKCPGNCQYCINNHCGCVAGQSVYADAH